MNTRAAVSVATLTFIAGVVVGVAGTRSNLFARTASTPSVAQESTPAKAANVRALLAEVAGSPGHFVLSGTSQLGHGCDELVTGTLHEDYMEVELRNRFRFFLPYTAIYRIDQEGPGSVTVPVVYTTVRPQAQFCGD